MRNEECPTQSHKRLKINVFSAPARHDAAADDAALQLRTGLHSTTWPDNAVLQLHSGFNHGPGTDDIDATQHGPGCDLRRWINRRAIHAVQS